MALIGLILVTCALLVDMELPLPKGVAEFGQVSGKIETYTLKDVSTRGGDLFVGLTLNTSDSPYLRLNDSRVKREYYEDLCERHAQVEVKYRVAKKVFRPDLIYWIVELTDLKPEVKSLTSHTADKDPLKS